MTEWSQADLEAMIHTTESRSLADDLREDIDRVFHRHVAKVQIRMVEELSKVRDMAASYLVTAEGTLITGDQEAVFAELAIRDEFEEALAVMRDVRDRAVARMLRRVSR